MAFRIRFTTLAATLLAVIIFVASAAVATEGAAAAKYVVAQCGWRVGQDASWYDTSADRFLKKSYCQPPESSDALDGVHMVSQARESAKSVSGTRIATWRWQAPEGTAIVNVHGQRWQFLGEGFQHRLGGVPRGGSFSPRLALETSDEIRRDFWFGFEPGVQAFESRLGCYRPEESSCRIDGTVLAGVRALTFTIDDPLIPAVQVGGPLTGTGWLRGVQAISFSNQDRGSGLRYAQTSVDNTPRASSEMSCAIQLIAGQWRGTRMQPCPAGANGTQSVDTRALTDGPHVLRHCAFDLAGNAGCAADRTIRIDNNPPAAPRALAVEGGEDWHRSNDFNLTWSDPDQGAGSPVASSFFRLTGAAGEPIAFWGQAGSGSVRGVRLPGPGEYRVRVWLGDQAGNSDEGHFAEANLRLDDVPPAGYFADPPEEDPGLIRVPVTDRFSGVAGGSIAWRPADRSDWHVIPSRYSTGGEPALTARFPEDLPRGLWVLRAMIADRAGNLSVTDRRANGSVMTVKTPLLDETTLEAWFTGRRSGSPDRNTVDFGHRARLEGRLAGVESGGITDAELQVSEIPLAGSREPATVRKVKTDDRGFFDLFLDPGPGRKVLVKFAGTRRLQESQSGVLDLKVKGKISFRARPKRLRTGRVIRFRGHVAGRGAWQPARGNLVQIQYFEEAAGRWRPVVLARTDSLGDYRARYRFRYITGVARIRLRALLVPSARFPYAESASKPVTVRVRG